jgi:hypothetical protein
MPAHEINLNLDHLLNDMREVQYRIQRAFYEDIFLMLARAEDQQKTAREIAERHEEKLFALAPVVGRTDDELLDPIINRAYLIMERAGMLPPPPPELEGVKLTQVYISTLATALKMVGVGAQDRFVASIAPIIEADPSMRFKIDSAQLIDDYADKLGINPKIIRATEEAAAMAAAEAQQQQAQADAERAATLAKAGRDASQTPIAGGGSALDRLMSAQAGGVQ